MGGKFSNAKKGGASCKKDINVSMIEVLYTILDQNLDKTNYIIISFKY